MKKQFRAPSRRILQKSDFLSNEATTVYWLGTTGVLINSHGTILLIDPTISFRPGENTSEVHGRKFLVPPPISPIDIPKVDAILYSHADEDHMGCISPAALIHTGAQYHGTCYSIRELIHRGVPEERTFPHNRRDCFRIGAIEIQLTDAQHPWQLQNPAKYGPAYTMDDCCGYLIKTPEGTIWHPGDTQLLDTHFTYDSVDLMFIDFSKDDYHFGPENTLRLVNHYRNTALIPYHYGTFDLPEDPCSNANPNEYLSRIFNPNRVHILGIGEPYELRP